MDHGSATERDDAAFDRLVARHGGAIHRLAVAIVGPHEAPDVTQEVLLRAWRGMRGRRDAASEAVWVRRIVVNLCIDRGRAAARRPRTVPIDIESVDAAGYHTTAPDDGTGDPALEAALRRLPVEQRTVIALHYAADLALPDVAAALGVPVGTAKSRLAAALERLRRDLGAER